MSTQSLEQEIARHILETYLEGASPDELKPETPLISGGILDSLNTLKLVQHLERSYGIAFEAHEVSVDYLDTVRSIAATVQSKLPG